MSPPSSPNRGSDNTTPRQPNVEISTYSAPNSRAQTPRRRSFSNNIGQTTSPQTYDEHQHLMSDPVPELYRKKSLVRHDRRPIDPNQRDYHYIKHARGMNVHPSSTGNDPTLEGDEQTTRSSSTICSSFLGLHADPDSRQWNLLSRKGERQAPEGP
jgi:chitin synthase